MSLLLGCAGSLFLTLVVCDEQGRKLAQRTVGSSSSEHRKLVASAATHDDDRCWAVEDCRHLSRRLERDLGAAGERIVRVPPKLMAHARDSARGWGGNLRFEPATGEADSLLL